ncbi:MAG: ATP-dependent helicase [Chloroflexota bacterium]|nr:ATP-dependent helicase [Chloroflexota bacterium]
MIAGAGTGKTRVIVERVGWLLETHRELAPEQILVLTYNVKAARELQTRIEGAVGPAIRARITVGNFHSFCHRILTESAAEAGLPPNPDVLDGIGQLLLIRDLRPNLGLVYHNTDWALAEFVKFINRAKDELVTPADFEAFVATERKVFEDRYGTYADAAALLATQGNLAPPRAVCGDYAKLREKVRAEERGEEVEYDPAVATKTGDREARRTISGTGKALYRSQFEPEQHAQIDELADTYVKDGAALEVMRLTEIASVYRAYQEELAKRGALDFGEQIAAVTQLFKVRPNLLRRWQRQFHYILVDEFQDVNIAQIELIELLGRTPDRPDNVMVVGDDDQSIYRFRGASFAAFSEFDRRFSLPPRHHLRAPAPGAPPRLRIEQNFRSFGCVLDAANRLIGRNQARFEPDKRLRTDRGPGAQVEVVVCAGPEDEAVVIVDAIRDRIGDTKKWSDAAVLYRKHKHREAIVARLRDEDIPYTVVGGLSLFATPEIRDLEQSLRAIADPHDSVALTRMMTAGPWRLDPLEILHVSRAAAFDRRHLIDAVHDVVAGPSLRPSATNQEVARVAGPSLRPSATNREVEAPDPSKKPEIPTGAQILATQLADSGPTSQLVAPQRKASHEPSQELPEAPPATRAKLRRLLTAIEELQQQTWREGPFTILERYLEMTGQMLDLVAVDTTDAHRMVTNIASFMRFAADWQSAHPKGTLAGFVDYLDAYQAAGGELPTSVELTEDVEGVRLMTLYQAKGLEFPHVFVPALLEGEWPTREGWGGYFPTDLLREKTTGTDIHTEEERRLLYVAMTRTQERLMLTTHGGPTAAKPASLFIGEILEGHLAEVQVTDRANSWAVPEQTEGTDAPEATTALLRRVMPMPSKRERRLALRLRATELIGLLEGTDSADPEAVAARAAFEGDLAGAGQSAAMAADAARAAGLDPLTFRNIALDTGAGANLLEIASLPPKFSYSSFSTYEACPLRYAFSYVYRIPPPSKAVAAFAFGGTAHEAFEAFTKERRERAARGDAPPTREDLERLFRERWVPTGFGDRTTEEAYGRRVNTLLENFWSGEVSSIGEAIKEEEPFNLVIEDPAGGASVVVSGSIDRIDRLPSGRVEVIDYKTGRISSQKGVDESLQLSIYALACRDVLGLGTPERVTLYFTESATRLSTTRTDEQLDAARADILARAARIRSGDFAATPSTKTCQRCDYARLCPSSSAR